MLMDSMSPEELQALRKKAPYIRTTTASELEALLGLMILRGLYRQNYRRVRKFWSSFPIFSATMSSNRYQFLHHYIRFEQQAVIDDGWPRDRGVAVRRVYEMWNDRLPQAVKAGKVLLLDQNQMDFSTCTKSQPSGRSTFIRSKPNSFGCNLHNCCNSGANTCTNSQPYV